MNVTRELVQTTTRGWRKGVISQGAAHHANCRKCGGRIWFGQVQFKGSEKPSWVIYSEAGHGGSGSMVMEKHDCNNPNHRT